MGEDIMKDWPMAWGPRSRSCNNGFTSYIWNPLASKEEFTYNYLKEKLSLIVLAPRDNIEFKSFIS